ncbi:MAG: guanylate kinase [Christensenella sp.]
MTKGAQVSKEGKLIVISGPSGAGKGTIVEKLLADKKYGLSISCTTRAPRGAEQEGINYFFKSKAEFEKMIEQHEFLEYADVFGCYYGTPKEYVMNKLNSGKSVILEIDVQGALQVKENYPKALMIFILPPTEEILLARLRGRKTETEEQIEKRFGKAKAEMARADKYDYNVINDDLITAVDEVRQIIENS